MPVSWLWRESNKSDDQEGPPQAPGDMRGVISAFLVLCIQCLNLTKQAYGPHESRSTVASKLTCWHISKPVIPPMGYKNRKVLWTWLVLNYSAVSDAINSSSKTQASPSHLCKLLNWHNLISSWLIKIHRIVWLQRSLRLCHVWQSRLQLLRILSPWLNQTSIIDPNQG